MAGAALRGFGKALLKKTRPKYLKKISRGTPTKAGLVARKAALRGEALAKLRKTRELQAKGVIPKGEAIPEFIKKRPVTSVGIAGVALGAAQYRRKKLYEAKDKQKKKLEKSVEEHKKKTKEQKEKQKK